MVNDGKLWEMMDGFRDDWQITVHVKMDSPFMKKPKRERCQAAVHRGLAFHHTLGREPVLAGWHVPGWGGVPM
jgi:hypothetical protein